MSTPSDLPSAGHRHTDPGIASSVFRLADSRVLLIVASTPTGPAPAFTQVAGERAVVAFTDVGAARADQPEGHALVTMQVAELLTRVPPDTGLLVDPRSPTPVHVPAARVREVVEAGRPFPVGAVTATGEPAQEPVELVQRLRDAATPAPWLRRLWRLQYQVADAEPKLLVVHEVDDPARDREAAELLAEAGAASPIPLLVMALDDLPPDHRQHLLHAAPLYERA